MRLETSRLTLRPFCDEDAPALYRYASNPNVGLRAGWPPHESEAQSLQIIRELLSAPHTFAIVLRETGEAIGSCGIMLGKDAHSPEIAEDECEVGFWIAEEYWGRGLAPEALALLLDYATEVLKVRAVWGAYFDGNDQSRRVLEKCGFIHHHTERDKPWTLIGRVHTEHYMKRTTGKA